MRRVIAQAIKEWCEFKRDRLALALAFVLPVLSLFLFGYGIRLESRSIPLVVQDLDNSQLSHDYLEGLYGTDRFVRVNDSVTASTHAIDAGAAKLLVTIPQGFAARVKEGQPTSLQVLVDGTDIANSQVIFNMIKAVNSNFLRGLAAGQRTQIVVPDLEVKFNPARQEALFIVPAVYGVVLWMFPALLGAVAASREKEQETIIHVYSSRLTALEFILGKAALYFLVAMLQAVLVIGLGWFWFHIGIRGDPTPFLVATPLYVLVSVLFGIMLGTYANSQTVAVQATSTLGFFPCLLLSGFVYPIDNIPFPLSLFSLIVPARYYIELCRDAFIRGTGWAAVWTEIIALVTFVVVLAALSWFGTRKMQLKD